MASYIIAHDLGTSGNKVTAFDEQGRLVCSYTHSYDTHFFNTNWAEQDPDAWWEAVCTCTQDICQKIDPKDIAALSFSGQMQGCLCVDEQGSALYPHLLYCDQRAEQEAGAMIDALGFEYIYTTTGQRPSSTYSIEKLLWMKHHLPEVFKHTHKILNAKDYMILKLTGVFMTERNDASGTNAMDIRTDCWSEDILRAVDIPSSMLPDIHQSTDIVGYVTAEAARQTGLLEGTPVVAGAGDGGCATIGAGSIRPGSIYTNIGSSAWTSATTDEPVYDPEMKLFTFAHPIEGLFHPCGTMQTAGSSFKWFVDALLKRFATVDDDSIYTALEGSTQEIPVGSNGLLFLPYLMGERTPWWDPHARGTLIGIGMDTSADDIAHAIYEGIAMNLNYTHEIFKKSHPTDRCTVTGGGARMSNLIRILASVTGLSLEIPKYLEVSTSMGAAVIGGVGCGLYPSFDIIDEMNPVESVIEPSTDRHEAYKQLQKLFEQAYRQNRDLYRRLDGILSD